jgi:hypothetical protein
MIHIIITANIFIPTAYTQDTGSAKTYKGTVIDMSNAEKLQYVNIGIKNSKYGTISDQRGCFEFKLPENIEFYSITFSSIGYQEFSLKIIDIQDISNIQVELSPIVYSLSETIVESERLKQKERGFKTKSRKMVAALNGKSFGSEIGSRINIRKGQTLLKELKFHVVVINPDSAIFRLKIYDMSSDTIGENLLTENVIFTINKNDIGVFTLDLLPYEIIVYNDILASVELLSIYPVDLVGKSVFSDRINVSIGIDLSNSGVYKKSASFNNWEYAAKNVSMGFWFTTLE